MIWKVNHYDYSRTHRCTTPVKTSFVQADSKEEAGKIICGSEESSDYGTRITRMEEVTIEDVLKSTIINYNV